MSSDRPATTEVLRFRASLTSIVCSLLLVFVGGACSVALWNQDQIFGQGSSFLITGSLLGLLAVPRFFHYVLRPVYEVSATGLLERNLPFLPPLVVGWSSVAWHSVRPDRAHLVLSLGSGKVEQFNLTMLSRRTRDHMITAIDVHLTRST